MHKGMFTQGFAILLEQQVAIDDLISCVEGYTVPRTSEAGEHWELSGPSFLVEYRPDVNGYVSVDVVGRKWPDHMGDPKGEPMLFAAWGMGQFGPFAYPNALERACQQSWRWNGAEEAVARHTAFSRIRLSYAFGTPDDAPIMPQDCDAWHELSFLTTLTQALLEHPAAICYFNPNGEVVLPADQLAHSMTFHAENSLPALDLWCNVRLFKLSDEWSVMDSVGNAQLDIPDHEVAFPTGAFDPQEVDRFIRNASLYILQNGMIINEGDTMDGPGDIRWQGKSFENGLSSPPRQVLRWLPTGIEGIPDAMLEDS